MHVKPTRVLVRAMYALYDDDGNMVKEITETPMACLYYPHARQLQDLLWMQASEIEERENERRDLPREE